MAIMKKRFSIVLAAGLLAAGISAASAAEMRQSSGSKMSPQRTYGHHNVYAGHINSRGQQHAAFTVQRDSPRRNVDID
jgi:hypothetical protein